jgi:predicted ATPase
MIEQPELHIHPAMQVELGDLFIANALNEDARKNGRCFLIETHSEHLVLRLLRRVRESSEEGFPENRIPIDPNDVNILFLENFEGRLIARNIKINKSGEFVKAWPGGFFDERLDEIL